MGSIYWQFNDCWPVASWSSVDSNLRYKALHYAAKKFYAPVEMGIFLENDTLTVNISNETMSDFEGEIKLYLSDSQFDVKAQREYKVFVDSLKSCDVLSFKADIEDIYDQFIYVDLYDREGNFVCRNTQLLTAPKHFNWQKPTIEVEIKDVEDGVEFAVTSDVFAKGVNIDFEGLDCVLSDNFFDLTNNRPYIVKAKTNYTAEELKNTIKVMSVYDIGR